MKRFLLVNIGLLRGQWSRLPSISLQPVFLHRAGKSVIILIAFLSFSLLVNAQSTDATQKEADYKKVVTERVAKIINVLDLKDSGVYEQVLNIVVNQYIRINSIQDQYKASVAENKQLSLTGEEMAKAVQQLEQKKSSRLLQLHEGFIAQLKEIVTGEQLEKIKDGMTYRVFPITYAAYQDMIPGLTAPQKEQIYAWLKEARELAMDEGTSDDKHKVFGKYKGRINNYLSAAGYDMKKEGEEWQKRIKEREKAAKEKTAQIP